MTHDPVIEAAARALCAARNMPWEQSTPGARKFYHDLALSVLPALSFIEAAALERAAKACEEWTGQILSPTIGDHYASLVRALKQKP